MKKSLFLLLISLLFLCGCTQRAANTPAALPEPLPSEMSATPAPASTPEPSPEPEPEPMPEAKQLGLMLHHKGQTIPQSLEVSNTFAGWIDPGCSISYSSEEPISVFYIKWNQPPGEWTLSYDGGEILCGQSGFLHECVFLPKAVTELTVTPKALAYFCGATGFTDGTLPSWVQLWQKPWDQADLLVLSTHNDDDLLFFGGAEPYYARERGYRVQVVYFTNHWRDSTRPNETLDGLWTMGIDHYPIISPMNDYELNAYSDEDGAAYLCEQLRRFKPSVVLSQDQNGEYGHGAHFMLFRSLKLALNAAPDASSYPESAEKYGVWDVPKTYLHLYGEPDTQTIMDWDQPLASFGGLTGFELAEKAYACHVNQNYLTAFRVYGHGTDYDCYRFGLYRSTVGEDKAKNDFFENLEVSSYG